MEYDESLFKARANKRARNIWLVFSLLLTANYGADLSNGLRTPGYYIVFLLLCWVPFFSGQILMKVQGPTQTVIVIIFLSVMAFFIYLSSVRRTHPSHSHMHFR